MRPRLRGPPGASLACGKLSSGEQGGSVKSHTVYKTFHVEQRRAFVRITEDVQRAVDESGISEDMAVSYTHLTLPTIYSV